MSLWDYRFLNILEHKFQKTLRRHYSKKQTKYNLRLIRAIYTNLASRYGLKTRDLYRCLPLQLKIDPEIDGYAYGVCHVRDYHFRPSKFFKKKLINCSKSTICLQKTDITSTTFIHEFGHYIRYLIGIMVALFNNSQALEDFRTICSLVGNKTPVSTYTHRQFFICGLTTEQEELFARSWEQYMKDGVAPSREYIKLFKNFRLNIVMDGHHRDERKKFENYEDLSDSFITPAKKKFFGELLVGKKTQVNWLREIMFFCLYTCSLVALLTFISSPLSSILLNKIAEFLRN